MIYACLSLTTLANTSSVTSHQEGGRGVFLITLSKSFEQVK